MTVRRRFALTVPPVLFASAVAHRPANAQTENPFATHKLVLQLSDASIDKQALIVSVANSVLKQWPDTAQIDVVAFGAGVGLLYANSPKRVAVDSLIHQGVRFDICMNTIDTIIRRTGHAPDVNPLVQKVDYGVPRIMELVSQGYILVRP